MPYYDLTCPNNHHQIDILLKLGERPPCPICGEPTSTLWQGKFGAVIDDSIPGGLVIRHGLCNEDGSPRTYYSKTEIRAEEQKRGYTNIVTHVTAPGTDKSKHTTRWI